MSRWIALALVLAVLLGFTSNQTLSRNDVFNTIGSGFSWSGAAQAWSGNHQLVTKSDFTTFISNNGNCAPGASSNYVMVYSDMTACATNAAAVSHNPILANNSFSGGSFVSWTADAITGSCTGGAAFAGVNATDEDADTGYAKASSTCFTNGSTSGTFGLTQTFSIPATPTSQSYFLAYQAPTVNVGDPINCSQGTGSATNLTVKLNGVVQTAITPAYDGTWHTITGSTTSLVSGTNTIDISVQLSGASGQNNVYGTNGTYFCRAATASQSFYIDNVQLTGTW